MGTGRADGQIMEFSEHSMDLRQRDSDSRVLWWCECA